MSKRTKTRPRTERRERERAAKQIVGDRQKLARLVTGGAPEHPFVVETSAVIDGRAQSLPCPLCDARLSFLEQTAERNVVRQGEILRCTHLVCTRCHVKHRFWFRIVPPVSN